MTELGSPFGRPASPVTTQTTQLQRRVDAWLKYQSRSAECDFLLREFLHSTYAYDSLSKEALTEISKVFGDRWQLWVDASPGRKRKKVVPKKPVKKTKKSLRQKHDYYQGQNAPTDS